MHVSRYNLFADIHRLEGKAQIGLYPSGGIRRDIDEGEVTVQELLDAWPFLDDVVTVAMTGEQLLAALEQGLSLERGIMQVSGITVRYDPDRPIGSRILSVDVDGQSLEKEAAYSVATGRFMMPLLVSTWTICITEMPLLPRWRTESRYWI